MPTLADTRSSCSPIWKPACERLVEPVADRERVVLVADVAAQQRELVAAEAGGEVVGPRRRLQALGDRLQQRVADLVAERVVDVLEAVEVEEQHRDRAGPLVLARGLERLVERGEVQPAVRQARSAGRAASGGAAPPSGSARAGPRRASCRS